MKRYDIFLQDRCYSVFPSAESPSSYAAPPSEVSIYLSPVSANGCALSASVLSRVGFELWEITLALSYFFRRVRGYPKTELDIELCGRAETLRIFDTPPGYSACCLPKCNSFCTNSVIFPDGTERELYTAHIGGGCRILPVESSSDFDVLVLSRILVLGGLPDARRAVGYSSGELILGENDRLTPYILSAVASVFGASNFSFRGESYPVFDSGEGLFALFPARHLEVNI